MITEYSHNQVIALCQQSNVGKKLPNALYVHISAIACLSPQLQECERQARSLLPKESKFTLIKFNYEQPKISYLFYPEFDTDPHPALYQSIQVDLQTKTTQQRDYYQSPNPPILHRIRNLAQDAKESIEEDLREAIQRKCNSHIA